MNLRHALKSRTDDLHAELDSLLGRFDLADRDQYRAFLHIHARVLPAVERALEQGGIADILPDWEAHRRTPLLERDLVALGQRMPSPLAPPTLAGRGELLGTAYVIEGSRLGSRFLAKRVGDAMPSEYLTAAGQQQAWPALLQALDHAELASAETDRAVNAARACFALFLATTAEAHAHG
jgi:heme oxygenase (biliverdin-IX-beta and delta-forming)